MSVRVRPAALADIPALREMLVATWHATYDATLGVEKVNEIAATWHSLEKLTAELAGAEANPEANAFLVAEQGGALVATASVHRGACGPVQLARIYVAPGAQGHGIGKALLGAAMAHFPGAFSVRLEVEPRNAKAIAFYARHGFRTVAEGSACGGDTRAAVEHLVMEAALPLMALRPAEDRDAQDLFGLMALCFAEYPGCFVDPHDDMPDLVRPGHWKERETAFPEGIRRKLGGEFLVLDDARGRVCACVAVDFPERDANGRPVAELHRLYVRPDCRRRGIAARLVGEAERLGREAGAGRMLLWSDMRFVDAHRLYERLGYVKAPATRALGDISNTTEYRFDRVL